MKFALLVSGVLAFVPHLPASEAALDPATAAETLRVGLEAHPDQAVVLFQDALQTNPDNRRILLETALVSGELDPALLARLLYAARLEFPDNNDDFAEIALTILPDRADEIRSAFLATPDEMSALLAGAETTAPANPEDRSPPVESRRLDEQIRDAIARVTARAEGKDWPEQSLSKEPVLFKKPDEIRIPRKSRGIDETSLSNHLPIDRTDERAITPGTLKIDDHWRPSAEVRLDETKFKTDSRRPLEAKGDALAPAGAVALPKRPPLPRSSVYPIPASADSYESTIDQESAEQARPPLVIRPPSTSPSLPR